MPSLEQREPTKPLEDRSIEVIAALAQLSWMPGFPESEKALEMIARIIARFCETVEVNHYSPDSPRPEDLGWVVPLDYMIEEVAANCFKFPVPAYFREVYEKRFTPLDAARRREL